MVGFQNCAPGFEVLSSFSKNVNGSSGSVDIPADVPVDRNASLSVYVRNLVVPQGQDLSFKIELNKTNSAPVVVQLQPKSGTAMAGIDFVDAPLTATIPAGQLYGFVKVMNRVPKVDVVDKRMSLRAMSASVGNIIQSEGIALIKATRRLPSFLHVGTNESFSCGLTVDRSVHCWGGNYEASSNKPLLADVKVLYSGGASACAVTGQNVVKCWGQIPDVLKDLNSYEPVEIPALADAREITFSDNRVICAVNTSNVMNCIGALNYYPAAGLPTRLASPTAITNVKRAFPSYNGGCAITFANTVSCWNAQGVFTALPDFSGVKDFAETSSQKCMILADDSLQCISLTSGVASFPALKGVQRLMRIGADYPCAVLSNGTYSCWGGYDGPVKLAETLNAAEAVDVSGSGGHWCIVTKLGATKCWGKVSGTPVGFLANYASPIPVDVIVSAPVKQFSSSFAPMCGLLETGVVVCGGGGSFYHSQALTEYSGLGPIKSTGSGVYHHCALTVAGSVFCWGLGPGNVFQSSSINLVETPTDTTGLTGVKALGVARYSTCVITASESVKCWGYPYTLNGDTALLEIPGSNGAMSLSLGTDGQGCIIMKDGTMKCWEKYTSPVASVVTGIADAKQIAVGYGHRCILNSAGKVLCWGSNDLGQLGLGVSSNTIAVPTETPGLGIVKQIVTGDFHTCALTTENRVKCWGANFNGQIGTSVLGSTAVPSELPGLSDIRQIQAGYAQTSFFISDGTVRTMGLRALEGTVPLEVTFLAL